MYELDEIQKNILQTWKETHPSCHACGHRSTLRTDGVFFLLRPVRGPGGSTLPGHEEGTLASRADAQPVVLLTCTDCFACVTLNAFDLFSSHEDGWQGL